MNPPVRQQESISQSTNGMGTSSTRTTIAIILDHHAGPHL